jgi:hypothetical protein
MKLDDTSSRGIFWGGLTGGIASALPLLQLGNCLCCLWAWVSGIVALLLVVRDRPDQPPASASLGALAGLWAGLVAGLLGLLAILLFGPPPGIDPSSFPAFLPADFDPQFWTSLSRLSESNPLVVLLTTLLRMGLFALFGMLGALVTAALRPRPGDRPESDGTAPPR